MRPAAKRRPVRYTPASTVRPRVYVETSVLSYLTALPSRDLISAARQRLTIEWWDQRHRFDLWVSEAVLAEAGRGDPSAATRRLNDANGLPILAATVEAQALAVALLRGGGMPRGAAVDAAHVAIATAHGADYLLTWNCTHIANAVIRPRIEATCRANGYRPPVICTPEELGLEEEA